MMGRKPGDTRHRIPVITLRVQYGQQIQYNPHVSPPVHFHQGSLLRGSSFVTPHQSLACLSRHQGYNFVAGRRSGAQGFESTTPAACSSRFFMASES